jgi:hypothetical protein
VKQLNSLLSKMLQRLGLMQTPAMQPIPVHVQRAPDGPFHGVRPVHTGRSGYPMSASGAVAHAYRQRHAGSG